LHSGQDIAEENLRASEGLPGAEGVKVEGALRTLDQWAARIRKSTEARRASFQRDPGYYDHSFAKFRMIQLVLALQEDFAISYDMTKAEPPSMGDLATPAFFRDASRVFVCGLVGEARLGTCASLPVLVAALGRRLGYPLKLVPTKGHLFVRWEEDGGERFNIETAGRGVDFPADDHYRAWPIPFADDEGRREGFLRSMTMEEEVALFQELRGYCLMANGRYDEAVNALKRARSGRPESANLRGILAHAEHLATTGGR